MYTFQNVVKCKVKENVGFFIVLGRRLLLGL
jgi:hypothetical protein